MPYLWGSCGHKNFICLPSSSSPEIDFYVQSSLSNFECTEIHKSCVLLLLGSEHVVYSQHETVSRKRNESTTEILAGGGICVESVFSW